jgi:hypothetical protein
LSLRRLAFVPLIVSTGLGLVGIALLARTPREAIPVGSRPEETIGYFVVQLVCGIVGGLVALRRPDNSIGWALGGMALIASVEFVTVGYALYGLFGPGGLPFAALAAWAYSWAGIGMASLGGWIVLTFPEGVVGTRRAATGLVAVAIGSLLVTANLMFRAGPLAYLPSIVNPLGHAGLSPALGLAAIGGAAAFALAIALGVAMMRQRFASADGVERQQLKWFLGSLAVVAAITIPTLPFSLELVGDPVMRYVARVATVLAFGTLPLAIGFAVLRYRLYDIDLLIRRTLVYAAVSAVLLAAYVGGVALFHLVLAPITAGSGVAVAISTLVVVALFQPLRRRIQEGVDRRFYRSRYDAARTLDSFAVRLRDEVDLDAVRADLLGSVRQTMAPAHLSLWLRERAR